MTITNEERLLGKNCHGNDFTVVARYPNFATITSRLDKRKIIGTFWRDDLGAKSFRFRDAELIIVVAKRQQ